MMGNTPAAVDAMRVQSAVVGSPVSVGSADAVNGPHSEELELCIIFL
jgi:hypothetical protein